MDNSSLCKYNKFIVCGDQSRCAWCGWDPETAARRLAERRAAHKAQESGDWPLEQIGKEET